MCDYSTVVRTDGKIEGAVVTYKDLGKSVAEAVAMVIEKFGLKEDESQKAVDLYWK